MFNQMEEGAAEKQVRSVQREIQELQFGIHAVRNAVETHIPGALFQFRIKKNFVCYVVFAAYASRNR